MAIWEHNLTLVPSTATALLGLAQSAGIEILETLGIWRKFSLDDFRLWLGVDWQWRTGWIEKLSIAEFCPKGGRIEFYSHGGEIIDVQIVFDLREDPSKLIHHTVRLVQKHDLLFVNADLTICDPDEACLRRQLIESSAAAFLRDPKLYLGDANEL